MIPEPQIAAARARCARVEAAYVPRTVPDLLKAAAEDGRAALDVFDRGERLSAADIARQSARLARAFAARGIGPGDRVALMLPNRIDYPLLWLALAQCGAVHVPVNLRYTGAELSYVLKDAGACLLVADMSLDTVLNAVRAAGPGPTVSPERLRQEAENHDDRPLDSAGITPQTLLNIQYTSGTTGLPKGCMLSHDYWLRLAHAAAGWDTAPATRLLAVQPYFYMDPQWQTLKALMTGATLCLGPRLSASRYFDWARQTRADWGQVPALAARQAQPAGLSLRQVATFGWPEDLSRRFQAATGAITREAYGMTEIGMGLWTPPEITAPTAGAVGLAAPFRKTAIRDADGRDAAEGELWVRGPAMLHGYWGRADATAQAMPAGGWFRTGDLFRVDGQGMHWLVGRLKDMIRRAGENIAAREIEDAIRLLPAVADAAAVAVPDPIRGEEVGLWVEVNEGATLTPREILAHAKAHLAAFKLPRYIAFTDAFPRTASLKIAKTGLPPMDGAFDALA
ncbi:MAG: AMP-binding protein [Pseudomonadota bacterium]